MARAPSNWSQCISAVQQAAGRELSESDLEELFTRLQVRSRRYQVDGVPPAEANMRAARDLGEQMQVAAAVAHREKLINIAISQELDGRIREGSAYSDIRALLTGREGKGLNDAFSVDAQIKGDLANTMGPFIDALSEDGLLKVLRRGDKAFDRDVTRELWSIMEDGKGVTGNKMARRAAEIVNDAQENVRLAQNNVGAWIGKLDQYVARQSHDRDKLRAAGLQAWIDFIAPRLSPRTFDHLDAVTPESVTQYLTRVYNSLATGVHDVQRGTAEWGDVGAGTSSGNLAKRVSQERKLLFKDGDAWFDYNEEFGRGTLWDAVRTGLENGSRNTAIMRNLGTNPEAMLEKKVGEYRVRARDRGDIKEADNLSSRFLTQLLDTITRKSANPENLSWAKFTSYGSALQTLTKLGGVVITSIPDLAVTTATLRHNGVGVFESYANQIKSLLPKGAESKEVARLAGIGIDNMLSSVASRFAAADNLRGRASWLVDVFHKANMLEFWTDSMKHGVGTMLMHNLARNAKNEFDSLPPRFQTTLRRYGIEAAEWDNARATALRKADGSDYLLATDIEDVNVRTRFQAYIADQVREALTEPDAFSRTAATWGTQAGTAAGAAVRLMMQFKTYPITFMSTTLNRELFRNADAGLPWASRLRDGVDVVGMSHLIVATSLLGYVAMEMKNLSRGRDTRQGSADEPSDYIKLVTAAMLQGGGLGLYGDFLFGDASRMGNGPVMSLFGPTAGTLDDVGRELQLLRKWVLEGDPRAGTDARSGAIGLVRDNAPFLNMFYSRGLMDYFVWYRLQEASNPGYLRRYEERVRRENDQTFFISPATGDARMPR